MSRSTSSHPKRTSPQSVKPLDIPLELRCGACGRKGSYSVGRLFLDPTMTAKGEMWLNRAFGFTGYVRCVHCNAGGPWELTQSSTATLLVLMQESLSSPKDARVHSAQTTLFDGTMTRWATQGEAHLKQLIEKEPDNYYLWSRLGNLYMAADVPDLALGAFREAIKRNEHDVESLHSLAIILHDRNEDEAAAHHYQQALLHARHAPEKTSRDMLRNVIGHSMEMLSELHLKSGGRIPLMPEGLSLPQSMKKNKSDTPHTFVTKFDLSDEDDLDRLVDFWSTGKLSESVPAPAPKPRPMTDWTPNWARGESPKVGRNDPCPCGSGKKFKNCCMPT